MYERGRCVRCGKAKEKLDERKFKHCAACRKRLADYTKQKRKARSGAGLCYRCGGKLLPEEKAAGILNHNWTNCYPSRNRSRV
jgi:hypothetical protein